MAKDHRRSILGERHVKRNALSRQVSEYNQRIVEVSGEPDELKGSRPVRWRAIGNTGYAVRWSPILLNNPLIG